jgi:polyhydroxybutyrate depolymerase
MPGKPTSLVLLSLLVLIACAGCNCPSGQTLMVDGAARTYRLHLPEAYTEDRLWPLVVVLHPFTSSGAGMARLTGFDALAEREGFIVAYPDGLSRRWNIGHFPDEADDVGFVTALVDHLLAHYAVDSGAVYLTGASNGAGMTYRLMCEAGDRFAAAAVVMGGPMLAGVAAGCEAAVPMPLMIIHGTDDRFLPWEGGEIQVIPGRAFTLLSVEESLAFWRARNDCSDSAQTTPVDDVEPNDGTTTTRLAYEDCGSGAVTILYRVEGGGHTWPGRPDSYPEFIVGRTARDFSASEVIWEFFTRHRRPLNAP